MRQEVCSKECLARSTGKEVARSLISADNTAQCPHCIVLCGYTHGTLFQLLICCNRKIACWAPQSTRSGSQIEKFTTYMGASKGLQFAGLICTVFQVSRWPKEIDGQSSRATECSFTNFDDGVFLIHCTERVGDELLMVLTGRSRTRKIFDTAVARTWNCG